MAFSQSACAWLHHEIAPLSKCLYNRHHLQGKGCSPSPLKPWDVLEQKCPLMLTIVFTNFCSYISENESASLAANFESLKETRGLGMLQIP